MKLIKVLENCTIDGNRYAKGTISLIPIKDELAQKLIEKKLIEDVLSQVDVPQGEVDLTNYTTLEKHNELEETVTSNSSSIYYANKDIGTLKTDIETLKTDTSTLKTDSTTLKSDTSTLKTDTASLKTDVSTLKSDNTTTKSDVTKIKGDVTTAQGDIVTLKADVAMIEDKLNQPE